MADVESLVHENNQSVSHNGIASESKDDDSFGVSDGRIPDSAICSSSALNSACGANQARLNNQPIKEKYGAWSPMFNDKEQYLDVDLGDIVQVGSIATQGRPGFDQDGGWFVQSYSLASSTDGENFANLREYGISKVFEGNTDPETVVRNALKTALKCRYLRIRPVTWHNQISLRIEVYKFSGSASGPRKRASQQKSAAKAPTDRTKSRPGMRGKDATSRIEAMKMPEKVPQKEVIESIQIDVKKENGNNQETEEDGSQPNGQEDHVETPQGESDFAVTSKESFEVIEIPREETVAREEQEAEPPIETENVDQPHIEKKASVRNRAGSSESRPMLGKVDHLYSLKMKQASAVSTHNDGSKFIGKIKLIKKDETPVEDETDNQKETKTGIDCEIPEVVKQRLTDFKQVEIRERDSKLNEDLHKRRSVLLEDDLSYLNEMETSMHERLKKFKETEIQDREKIEISKQEEEKRRSLKQDAERRRSIALQKEQQRLQALIQKQKEEEEEKRKQREIAEKEASEEFVEIEAEAQVPAIVNDRLRLFKESEKQEKEKSELLKHEDEKRRSMKQDAEKRRSFALQKEQERAQALLQKQKEEEEVKRKQREAEVEASGEFVEINAEEAATVPAIVNDRLKIFKETEKQQQEKQKMQSAEGEKRKLARENAERKRLLSIQRDKEKLEELLKRQQEDEELRKAELINKKELLKEGETDKPEVPAIVHDRLRLFKEGEKAFKEKSEAQQLEAERRKSAKAEAERKRTLAGDRGKPREEDKASIDKEVVDEEEEIVMVEDSLNVESEITFDFMEEEEDNLMEDAKQDEIVTQEAMSSDDKQRIREAKEKFMFIEKAQSEPTQTEAKRVGKLNVNEVYKERESPSPQSELQSVDSNGNITNEESLDLQTRLQGIDTHHEGYDPEQERRMLEEAEAAFRSFKACKKLDSKPKRSAKTENLIKSFSIASSTPSNHSPAPKGGSVKTGPSPKQSQTSSRPCLETSQNFDEDVIKPETSEDVCSTPGMNGDGQEVDQTIEPEQSVINSGLVKQRANIFSNPLPPPAAARDASETTRANVKKWIASNPPASSPRESADYEVSSLQMQQEKTEQQIAKLSLRIEQLKLEDREEEALDLEEEFHAAKLELAKTKRKILKIQKEAVGVKPLTRNSSSSSESHSMPDDAFSDRASSSSSRTPRGGSHKVSREMKAPVETAQPHVDVSAFNDDGEVVTEGNVISQIQTYEHESARQRKERAELRKSLSLSHSQLDDLEFPPPMGFGGPEFAKDKSKLSKECKVPRGDPLPPVESTAFNDEGECVPEGNVFQQVKAFSRN